MGATTSAGGVSRRAAAVGDQAMMGAWDGDAEDPTLRCRVWFCSDRQASRDIWKIVMKSSSRII